MRILIDQNLPRSLVTRLVLEGHDAAHTSDEGLERATDPFVFTACINLNRVLVTGDKKLTKFLAASSAVAPSVIIIRGFKGPIEEVAHALIATLPLVDETIQEQGNAVFSLGPERPTRVQLLPLGGSW